MVALAELKIHLKLDPAVSTEDALITAMETAAVAFMENETGLYFGSVGAFTDILATSGWAPIWLRGIPIPDAPGTPFLVERRSFPEGDYEPVAATDYEIDGQKIWPRALWTAGPRNLRVTYSTGFTAGAEPQDVRQAVREMVTRMFENRLPTVTNVSDSVRETIRAHKITVVG